VSNDMKMRSTVLELVLTCWHRQTWGSWTDICLQFNVAKPSKHMPYKENIGIFTFILKIFKMILWRWDGSVIWCLPSETYVI